MVSFPSVNRNAGTAESSPHTHRIDVEEARRHLQALGINPDEGAWIESVDDVRIKGPGGELKRRGLPGLKTGSLRVFAQSIPELEALQGSGAGVFIAVNEVLPGGRKNIGRIRAAFAELDHGGQSALDNLPLPPTLVVESSPGKYHPYWCSSDLTHEDFDGIMATMVERYGSDKNAKDRARILRLAGTWHMKDFDNPHQVRIVANSGRVYSRDEIFKAFPPLARRSKKVATNLYKDLQLLDTEEIDSIKSAVAHLQSRTNGAYLDDRATWLELGMALHAATGGLDQGYALWTELSRQSSKYDEKGQRDAWESFKCEGDASGLITLGTIFNRAYDHGWERPARRIPPGSEKGIEPLHESDQLPELTWPETDKRGEPKPNSQRNIKAFLQSRGVVAKKNEFSGRYEVQGFEGFRELNDEALRALRLAADSSGLRVQKEFFIDTTLDVARQNAYHPVRDYLNSLTWDGVSRLDTWLPRYAGAEDTALNRAFGSKFLLAAVARVHEPGIKFDQLLVLEGPQGVGKSSLARILAGGWFEDGLTLGADPKTVVEIMAGKWIGEISELRGSARDVESIKSMLSRTHDTAREAYARTANTVPRQFVLIGSTNSDDYLQDATGNRRIWPVSVGSIDLAGLKADREQILAEATARWRVGGESLARLSPGYRFEVITAAS